MEGKFHPAQEQMTASYLQRLLGTVACTFHLYAKTSAILSDCKESLLAGWKAFVAENLWSPSKDMLKSTGYTSVNMSKASTQSLTTKREPSSHIWLLASVDVRFAEILYS